MFFFFIFISTARRGMVLNEEYKNEFFVLFRHERKKKWRSMTKHVLFIPNEREPKKEWERRLFFAADWKKKTYRNGNGMAVLLEQAKNKNLQSLSINS